MQPPRFMALVAAALLGSGPATRWLDAQPASRGGVAALERMHAAYAGTWYSTLTFVQKTIVAQAARTDTTVWYESLSGPARIRIDIGDPALGNGMMATAESTFVMRNGALGRVGGLGNPFLPLIMGVYLQPVSATAAQLALFGFDLGRAHTQTFVGKRVTVVGASTADDTTSAQFWIEDERQVVVRVRGTVKGTGGADIHLGGYERIGSAWLATRITMASQGRSQTEEYSDWKANVSLSDELFDLSKWRSAPHWVRRRD